MKQEQHFYLTFSDCKEQRHTCVNSGNKSLLYRYGENYENNLGHGNINSTRMRALLFTNESPIQNMHLAHRHLISTCGMSNAAKPIVLDIGKLFKIYAKTLAINNYLVIPSQQTYPASHAPWLMISWLWASSILCLYFQMLP